MSETTDQTEAWLTENPGGTATQLAEAIGVQQVYAGQVLARLYREGKATRERSSEGTGRAYIYYIIDPEERTQLPSEAVKPQLRSDLPTSINFKVVAELKNGGLLLQYKGDFFVARMVDLADIVRI